MAPETFCEDPHLTKELLLASLHATGSASSLRAELEAAATLVDFLSELVPSGEEALYRAARAIHHALGDRPRTPLRRTELVVPDEEVRVVTSDLEVKGDVENGGLLLVLGETRIGGMYWDRDVGCLLVTLGSVTTRRTNVYGGAYVGGDWQSTESLYGIDHDWSIHVRGVVSSPLVLLEDKGLYADRVESRLDLSGEVTPELAERARELLVAEVLRAPNDDAGAIDVEALADRMVKGEKLFAS